MTARSRTTLTCGLAAFLFLHAPASYARSPMTTEMLVIGVIGIKEWCDERSPVFKNRSQSAYEQWLKAFQNNIAEVQGKADYPKELENWKNGLTEKQKYGVKLGDDQKLMVYLTCNDEFIELLGGSPMPEPEYSSPRLTWTRFVEAAKRGDHETAVLCLAAEARKGYLEGLVDPGEEALKRAFDGIRRTDFQQVDKTTVRMQSESNDGSVATTTFKLILGNWKITQV